MNRKWKVFRGTLWVAVFVAVIAIGAVSFHGFHHEGAMNGHQQQQFHQQQQSGFSNDNQYSDFHAQALYRAGYGEHGEHRGFHGGGLIALLGSLLLAVAGWKLWKHAGRAGRWIGGLLLAIALLPLVIPLIIPAAVIYFIWRALHRPARTAAAVTYAYDYAPTTRSVDALDEWEAKTRRELKNKEEK